MSALASVSWAGMAAYLVSVPAFVGGLALAAIKAAGREKR